MDPLTYHAQPKPGKLSVVPTKPMRTREDLALAYTPGVAQPCLEIARDPHLAYKYTNKGNSVAVISNGTAVLGLGNIGPLAGKPVMEGKAMLFKRFADIDAIDLEVAERDPERLAQIIAALAPSFGGINLEDIKAPECFIVERRAQELSDIPIFHDDQHGTAIVVAAATLNALHLTNRTLDSVRIVFSGAGAAAIAIANLLVSLGVRPAQIWMFDSAGLITSTRENLGEEKQPYAQAIECTLAEALTGADLFIGVSKANVLNAQVVRAMNQPIVLALANPDPELSLAESQLVPGLIFATGRSDYPNQVNNALCFPYLFRGALDTRAPQITAAMRHAAVHALAHLARAGTSERPFGPTALLPSQFDERLLPVVATAVARAAIGSGVATHKLDLAQYEQHLVQLSRVLAHR